MVSAKHEVERCLPCGLVDVGINRKCNGLQQIHPCVMMYNDSSEKLLGGSELPPYLSI